MSERPDLEELREVAEAATPGPWIVEGGSNGDDDVFVGMERSEKGWWLHDSTILEGKDARHIAAFDPPTALALLDAFVALEADRDRLLVALRHIGYEMPTTERNPDGDEQAAHAMQFYAQEVLSALNEQSEGG